MTETMTLRAAIGQRKLLDKQIAKLVSENKFIIVRSANEEIVNAQPVKDWVNNTLALWQSLNDKIKRRNALNAAILKANVEHMVKVPKFESFDLKAGSTETESITYADAISRKKYFKDTLNVIIDRFNGQVKQAGFDYKTRQNDLRIYVDKRLSSEFGTTTNASSKQREEREEKLLRDNAIYLEDPISLASKAKILSERITEYLETIDSIMGRETELTEITFEY